MGLSLVALVAVACTGSGGIVAGAELDTLWPLLGEANALTPWTDGDAAFGIAARPLLPSETGCPTDVV